MSVAAVIAALSDEFEQASESGTGPVFVVGVAVPAMPGFTVESRFKRSKWFAASEDGIRISNVSEGFTEHFGKLMVPDHSGSIIIPRTLARKASDSEIIDTLGGEVKAETSLAEIWYLMTLQCLGQNAPLLVNDFLNIFYVRDVEGVLRTVLVRCDIHAWQIDVPIVGRHKGGSRVFSRGSR